MLMQVRRDAEAVAPLQKLVALRPENANGWTLLSGAPALWAAPKKRWRPRTALWRFSPVMLPWLTNRGMLLQGMKRIWSRWRV